MSHTIDEAASPGEINVEPTKGFFIDMLIRDIPLEQAILDLLDNSVDGAKRPRSDGKPSFEDRWVRISFSENEFRIEDNCGGFGTEDARQYAFRFGRTSQFSRTSHSIGQFGVGMKRALFKFGGHFTVKSATADEHWAIDVKVEDWEKQDGWTFPWADYDGRSGPSTATPGTAILADKLRPEVAAKFKTKQFENIIIGLVKSKHRQFIAEGLRIFVNDTPVEAINLYLLVNDRLKPGVDSFEINQPDLEDVNVRIIAGLGDSNPREAGWYVICNGRVVLEADRRIQTGWGLAEEAANRVFIPSFHNQFARFRGIVAFDSADSARVPWNTTKNDVDLDSYVWRYAFDRMMQMMRPVIDFLYELDKDIDDFTREHSPLLDFVSKTPRVASEALTQRAAFSAPARDSVVKGPRYVKIQYSKPINQIQFLEDALSLSSAKAVGEKTFELVYSRQGGE